MVETGSALALLDEAAKKGGGHWARLRDQARRHLLEEISSGNDVQPHLHAFNDPVSTHFPYRIRGESLKTSLRFLVTPTWSRGVWASACPPPGQESPAGLDRVRSVERSVAQIETLGRSADPDYRAVLWRSGLLEYGHSPEERAWSAVALRRAGLLAVSDVAKPRSSLRLATPAFRCAWDDPDRSDKGGPLYQLPIVANLEGDFTMGPSLLRRRAKRTLQALKGHGQRPLPGVHLLTLLTHDKFVNARYGGDEFSFDQDRGDWITIRKHLEAWEEGGATFVTAREGIRELVEDAAMQSVCWLEDETYVSAPGAEPAVRYSVALLGRGIPFSDRFRHHLLATIPPSLRAGLESVELFQGGKRLECELEQEAGHFWFTSAGKDETLHCVFHLRSAPGPRLASLQARDEDTWLAEIVSPLPFRRANILLPWQLALPKRQDCTWCAVAGDQTEVRCAAEAEGLLISDLFLDDATGSHRTILTITAQQTCNAGADAFDR